MFFIRHIEQKYFPQTTNAISSCWFFLYIYFTACKIYMYIYIKHWSKAHYLVFPYSFCLYSTFLEKLDWGWRKFKGISFGEVGGWQKICILWSGRQCTWRRVRRVWALDTFLHSIRRFCTNGIDIMQSKKEHFGIR